MIRVTVWEEYMQSRDNDDVKVHYPKGIHEFIAGFLKTQEDFSVRTANLHEAEDGLPTSVLDETDVLIWWGHVAHEQVSDETVKRVQAYVLKGMGIIFLHSAHMSKPFQALMGTSCTLRWREANENERLWVVRPGHPLVAGVGSYVELEKEEMYGEFFDIPQPDEVVMIGWFKGGDVFRSLCTWQRGYGRVVYFQPGHETHPNYHVKEIQQIIINAVRWTYSDVRWAKIEAPNVEALEKL